MSDPSIDGSTPQLTSGVVSGFAAHADIARWWDEFTDAVGQKVAAWNERQRMLRPIDFTRRADGGADRAP